MRLLFGYRSVWLLAASLLIFTISLVSRLILQETSLFAAAASETSAHARMTTESRIADFQDRLRLNPEDTTTYAQLGLALLQRVRDTGDASLYNQAETAFSEALKRDGRQFEALIGQGLLALARHDFAAALKWGEQAKAVNPYSVQVYGIIGDAQIELGRYDAAAKTIQTMVDIRPQLSSYSRVSYLHELNGETDAAIAAMQQAVDSGLLGTEETSWAQVQLGHLYFNGGDLEKAEMINTEALNFRPNYIYAVGSLAQIRAAQGHYDEAIAQYKSLVEQMPLPGYVIALGELYDLTGQPEAAQQQYALVRAIEQLNASAGMNSDLEMALFEADHGTDPASAVEQAKVAYKKRPTIYGADVLAWALYQNRDYAEAQRYSQESLRLGTQDALLHFHAGMIAHALGQVAEAQQHLQQALDINPYFSLRYAPQAKQLLAEMK